MSKHSKVCFRKELALRTQAEVALLLGINPRSVEQTERRALLHVKRALLAAMQGVEAEKRRTRSRKEWRVRHRPVEPAELEYFGYELGEWRALAEFYAKYGAPEEAREIRDYVNYLQHLIDEARREFESAMPT